MNKKSVLIAVFACYAAALSAREDCFNSYNIAVNNNSGGLLEVKKTKGLVGISRKTELQDGQSATAVVKRRGSELKVVAGPEDQKSSRSVDIHSRMIGAHQPEITFTQNGIETRGFYTKDNNYKVVINNQSGGIARILRTCQVSGTPQKVAPGKSVNISVKPDAYIIVEIGPEKKKVTYQINFADQTGKEPSITLGKRSFSTNGIMPKDLLIRSQRITAINRPNLEAVVRPGSMQSAAVQATAMPQIKSQRTKRTKPALKKNAVVTKTAKKHPRFARRTK